MKRLPCLLLASLSLWLATGCTPAENPNPTPAVTTSESTPRLVGSPTAKPDDTAGMTGRPDLPPQAFETLTLLHVIRPEMKDQETWWADSGIRDNRLAYYGSPQQPDAVQGLLDPYFDQNGSKPFVDGAPRKFEFDGARLSVVRRAQGDVSQMYILVPISSPPVELQVLRDLKLPAAPPAELKEWKTLVVLATGQGLADHMDHMLANAGFTVPEAVAQTPKAGDTATPLPDPYATPVTQNPDR